MTSLPYGAKLCPGATLDGNLIELCRDCLRRTSPVVHAWQQWLEPPAKHDGKQWTCVERVVA